MVRTKRSTEEPIEDTPLTPRERRKQARDALRSKATGTGILIDIQASATNKKTTFDDNEHVSDEEKAVDTLPSKETASPGSDDEDDAIEEVNTSRAHAAQLEEQEVEKEAIRQALTKKKPKKRKARMPVEPEEDFSEDFFHQLDQEQAESRREQLSANKPKGKHTNFVVESRTEHLISRQIDANIQVVVLEDKEELFSTQPIRNAAAAQFSRLRIPNGSDGVTEKQLQKARKSGHKNIERRHWKRSKKMNRILQRGKPGMAAQQFVL